MDNFSKPGQTIPLTAPSGGVVSGQPYQIGSLVVVAAETKAQTLAFEALARGVVDVPKVADEVWTEAQKVYFDASEGKFTEDDDTAANPLVGVAIGPVAADVTAETDGLAADLAIDGLELTVIDYASLAGKTVSITVGGATTELLEEDSGAWEALTSNDATATSLAAAIDGIAGVAAAAVGAVITIVPGTGATSATPAIGRVRLDGAAR